MTTIYFLYFSCVELGGHQRVLINGTDISQSWIMCSSLSEPRVLFLRVASAPWPLHTGQGEPGCGETIPMGENGALLQKR